MVNRVTIQKITDYFGVFLLLVISGNPVITGAPWYKSFLILIGVIVIILLLLKLRKMFFRRINIYIAYFLGIFAIQYFNFGWNTLPGILGFSLKCLIGGYIIWHMKERFIPVYTNTMVFISGVSIFFFLLSLSGIISIPNLIPVYDVPALDSLGIYIDSSKVPKRNIGMFWEPGAFAGYIIVAFILNIQNFTEKFRVNKTKFMVLGGALISTQSTTGYILFFLFLIIVNFQFIKRNWVVGLLTILVISPLIYSTFINQDFLLEKITSQYESSIEKEGEYDPSRFGALLFDIHYIKKHPLTGNGLHERTRYADHPNLWYDRGGHGNGFSNFIASMGLLGMFFYLFYLHKSLPFTKNNKIVFVVLIILLLQGEQFLNFPLFLGLPFLNSSIKNSKLLENENCHIINELQS
jgi:hypothetical protein